MVISSARVSAHPEGIVRPDRRAIGLPSFRQHQYGSGRGLFAYRTNAVAHISGQASTRGSNSGISVGLYIHDPTILNYGKRSTRYARSPQGVFGNLVDLGTKSAASVERTSA